MARDTEAHFTARRAAAAAEREYAIARGAVPLPVMAHSASTLRVEPRARIAGVAGRGVVA